MKKTFIVATDKVDSQGDILKLDGVKIPDKVLMTRDFDYTQPLGYATVENTGSELIATANIPDEMLNTYPAIGFELIKSHIDGGIRYIDEVKLHYIGLSLNPNVDESIKRINEQLSSTGDG